MTKAQVTRSKPWSEVCKKKIISPHNLAKKVQSLKDDGETIITLNGSFDLLHAGHLYIIHQAKMVGGTLILALNSDVSVRKYKGPNKPLIPLTNRIELMTALEFVDYITWFDEPDPRHILSIICPHFHVNGTEYKENMIEEQTVREGGGEIYLVDRIPLLSTSEIIQKIIDTST